MRESATLSARPVCVLFGPQSSAIGESLSFIRNSLQKSPTLSFLEPVLEELPSLWPVLIDAWPALSQVPGATQLETLAQIARAEPVKNLETPLNVLLTPVTVIRQIIEFCAVKENAEHQIVDAQGFCVGFLAAVAVACSQSTKDFQEISSVMVRLAVYIGAAVDLDAIVHGPTRSMAVRWKSTVENKSLNQVLFDSTTVCKLTTFNSIPSDAHGTLTMTLIGLHFLLHRYKLCYNYRCRCRGEQYDGGVADSWLVRQVDPSTWKIP